MRNLDLPRLSALVGGIIVLFSTSGCSLIGLGVGATIDDSKPDFRAASISECATLKKGTKVQIVLIDGGRFQAEFGGLVKYPQGEYSRTYDLFRSLHIKQIPIPSLGDRVEIVHLDGTKTDCLFRGFDILNRLGDRDRKENLQSTDLQIVVSSPGGDLEKGLAIDSTLAIRLDSSSFVGQIALLRLFNEKKLPLRSTLALRAPRPPRSVEGIHSPDSSFSLVLEKYPIHYESGEDTGFRLFDPRDIDSLIVPNKKKAKWIGLGVGLALDAWVVTALILASSNFRIDLSEWQTNP